MINYIYLLQLREFANKNEPVYKIGMTTQKNLNRFLQYPKGSILFHQTICNNCKNIEMKLIKKFRNIFIKREDIGSEYFEGNYKTMIKMIYVEIENETVEQYNTIKYVNNDTKNEKIVELKTDKVIETTIEKIVETNNDKAIETTIDKITDTNNDNVIETNNNKAIETNNNKAIETTIEKITDTNNTQKEQLSLYPQMCFIPKKANNNIYNLKINTNFQCNNCKKIFSTNQRLKYHIDKGACGVNVKCDICNLSFKMQGGLKRHIEKIHANNSIITTKDLYKTGEDLENTTKNVDINNCTIDEMKCKYCCKIFTRKNNITQHQKKWCKIKKEIDLKNENSNNDLKNELDNLKLTVSLLENQIKNNQSNTNSKTINNGTINNINVTLNKFGEENISYISMDDYVNFFVKGQESVILYIKMKHFNPDHPENNNLYIPNIHNTHFICYDGDKYVIKLIDNLVNDVIDGCLIELNYKYKELMELIKSKQIKNDLVDKAIEMYGNFIKAYDGESRDSLLKYIQTELKLMMYNYKDMALKMKKQLK